VGGKTKKKKSAAAAYEAELDALDKRLAEATTGEELGEIAREYHSVGYSLGHDIPAIIANVELPTRVSRGKLVANERAAEAYARDGNVKHALYHLFEALETWPRAREDRDRLGERAATLLDMRDREAAMRIRECLAGLPDDPEKAAQAYANQNDRLKSFDWEKLPTGRAAD
jgi:hypothetical protein